MGRGEQTPRAARSSSTLLGPPSAPIPDPSHPSPGVCVALFESPTLATPPLPALANPGPRPCGGTCNHRGRRGTIRPFQRPVKQPSLGSSLPPSLRRPICARSPSFPPSLPTSLPHPPRHAPTRARTPTRPHPHPHPHTNTYPNPHPNPNLHSRDRQRRWRKAGATEQGLAAAGPLCKWAAGPGQPAGARVGGGVGRGFLGKGGQAGRISDARTRARTHTT